MHSFTFHNPTKIYFGKQAIQHLPEELKKVGTNILFVYGGGSIKSNGIYEEVVKIGQQAGKNLVELAGVMPNPRTEKVYEGIQLCKEYAIDFILAVGGGSVIDCAKAIAVGAKTEKDFWETFYVKQEQAKEALPLGTVLTLSATGTEMNPHTVISHRATHTKHGYSSDLLFPVFSVLDPTYTYSLPADQTAYGAVDILAHVFEQYFSLPDEDNVSDNLSEAVMRSVIDSVEVAIREPQNYSARSNLMRASTMALNTLIGMGKEQDWSSHAIEHALSGLYDIPHGAGLAIVFPAWMKYVYKAGLKKFVRYAKNIWWIGMEGGTDEAIALEGIELTKQFFKKIWAPVSLSEVGIPEGDIGKIASLRDWGDGGSYKVITEEDVKEILRMAV